MSLIFLFLHESLPKFLIQIYPSPSLSLNNYTKHHLCLARSLSPPHSQTHPRHHYPDHCALIAIVQPTVATITQSMAPLTSSTRPLHPHRHHTTHSCYYCPTNHILASIAQPTPSSPPLCSRPDTRFFKSLSIL